MLKKIWEFMKPKNVHQVVYLIGGIIAGLLLWPEVQIIMDHQGFISEERLIDTAMTKRWMLLDQRNTTGVKFKSKTGTIFIIRAYPDDSLLVSDGRKLRWLPSDSALKEIRASRPSNKWILDLIPGLGMIALAQTREEYIPDYTDGPKAIVGPTKFEWIRRYLDGTHEWCVLDTRTGFVFCSKYSGNAWKDHEQADGIKEMTPKESTVAE